MSSILNTDFSLNQLDKLETILIGLMLKLGNLQHRLLALPAALLVIWFTYCFRFRRKQQNNKHKQKKL